MANGLFAGGTGVLGDPYLIEDAHDLDAVRNNSAKHYKLINDIDLNVSPYNEGEGWASSVFYGVLDGNEHTISNLYINKPTVATGVGLFSGGNFNTVIKNLKVSNFEIHCNSRAGCILYSGHGMKIENCISENNKIITYVLTDGSGWAKILSGFLVGAGNGGTILKNCVSRNNTFDVTNNTGDVALYFGGAIGSSSEGYIENIYSSFNILGTNYHQDFVGFVGFSTNATFVNCFNDKAVLGIDGRIEAGVSLLTTEQMQSPQTFIDATWNLETLEDGTTQVWHFKQGEYPELWYNKVYLNKNLIKSNNLIYSLDTSNNLVDITSQIADINNITQLEYETLGFDDISLIDMTQLGNLQSPKSVIYYTDDTAITNPKLKHEYSFNIGTRLLKRG